MTDINFSFTQAYEDLKSEVNQRAGLESNSLELEKALQSDSSLHRHARMLRHVRDIRNLLQHPNHDAKAAAVLVSKPFLQRVRNLVEALRNPPTASSMSVPRSKLYTVKLTDKIGDVAEVMQSRKWSHVPILDEKDVVIGVFNEAAIFDYFWTDDVIDARRDMPIKDIERHCSLDARHTETFEFVRPSMREDEIIAVFTKIGGDLTRVGAVFVTPSGKPTEPITGMITPWDVLAR